MGASDMSSPSVASGRPLTRAKGRDKPQLSCDFCRKRKLRCDRQQPCSSCVRFGQVASCSIPTSLTPRTQGSITKPSANQTVFQKRIDHLESLVRSLIDNQLDETPGTTPSSEVSCTTGHGHEGHSPLVHDFGRIRLQKHGASYAESDHWSAILDKINDLRNIADEEADLEYDVTREEATIMPGTELFLMHVYPATKVEIIAALPPRHITDSIIAKYFKSADMPVTLIIHRRVFFKQYEAFWEDSSNTPILWITILLSMMFIVANTALNINAEQSSLDEVTLLEYQNILLMAREKIIQCLRLGNYMKGAPYTIEALLMFLLTEYARGEEAHQGLWQLTGTIIRVAFRMGYHRDGSHFPEMSVYEAEMRRRTWYMLIMFDVTSANLVGLPRVIREAQCDTAEPRSLLDDDFDDLTIVLPPPRLPSEHTLAQFLVHKSRVVRIYGMTCDFATSSKQHDYAEAMRLDRLLRKAFTEKPAVLETKPLSRCILDGTELITRRLYLALVYKHAQMTLHRRFMLAAKTDVRYQPSLDTCMDAALSTAQLQIEFSEHAQPGRMLHADRWKIFTLVQSEFLLATIILCYNFDNDIKNAQTASVPFVPDEAGQKSILALQGTLQIWQQQQGISKAARSACNAIESVLSKFQAAMDSMHMGSMVTDVPQFSTAPKNANHVEQQGTTAAALPQLSNRHQASKVGASTIPVLLSAVHPPPLHIAQSDSQFAFPAGLGDGDWNEFFDLGDESWESWIQM